ncbi:hypothetical protein SAG0176_01880 [Streptococcus agalactiae LDS 623]|uniref:Uncharacterized protein n=1 Tax=Streptococcus agalactiae TaxID=1311 RepID=A0A837KYZ7_STRAG|nr:hypothetical protein [Streptococcus agalactiae]EPU43002.1 hypothetical protein SAG0181_05495 [Streptococcus agalactiae LDS 628]EPV91377.1 hypothetical protein SAG0014_12455 [Streptococcus agalactiae FSL S3-586]EPX12315.1 hypothetical protein SAG0176_01880 [Streptococcus agalactiae LDS 623]KLL39048.1 hypothetical protein WA04_05450 [Streptococcus agalactiae]
MNETHIETFITLRKELSEEEWKDLDSLYNYLLENKKEILTKDITLNESELNEFREFSKKLVESNE